MDVLGRRKMRTGAIPLISWGETSEMYSGATMLSIPIPMPPINLPITSMAKSTAPVCMEEPIMKMMEANTIEYFREYLSATQPLLKEPVTGHIVSNYTSLYNISTREDNSSTYQLRPPM